MFPDYRTLIAEIAEAHASLDRLDGYECSAPIQEFAPVTTAALNDVEACLSCTFPPSYREFLLTVNGCSKLDLAHGGLLAAADLTWFRDSEPDWIRAYTDPARAAQDITEQEHLTHADDSARFRRAYLPHLLQIGDVYDGSVYLLNPLVKTAAGEWEAWSFANWYPGAFRKQSFADLITSAHSAVLRSLRLKNVPIDEKAIFAKALPILHEQISRGTRPTRAIANYLVSESPSDDNLAAWMRTVQPLSALFEALKARR